MIAAVLGEEKLQPGLPAEVMIGLRSHTAREYLIAPLNPQPATRECAKNKQEILLSLVRLIGESASV